VISLVIWMTAITLSIVLTILSAAGGDPLLHLAVTGAISVAIAVVGMQTRRRLEAEGASRSALVASTSRTVALVWIWGGLAMLITYQYILVWREWPAFVIGFLLVGGLCLALSMMFQKDADAGHDDEGMLKFARLLNVVQMVGMLIAMIGLVLDGKFSFGLTFIKNAWAANNIFFFGALAVACLGAHALILDDKAAKAAK
jgi:hypothetical protein